MNAAPPKNPFGRRGQTGQIITLRSPRNRTGRIGVYRDQRRYTFADGSKVTRFWWRARMGARRKSFPCATMGERDAYRAAVRQRMQWEAQAKAAAVVRRRAADRAYYAANRVKLAAQARGYRLHKKEGL